MLPATNGQNIYVPVVDECRALNISNCGPRRGIFPFHNSASLGFQSNYSSTWKTIGLYELDQNTFLGFSGTGLFGYDTISLPETRLQSNNQVVTAYANPEFWVGQIGLSTRMMNFRPSEQPESFLTSLKAEKAIPSLSFGYTAGAYYSKLIKCLYNTTGLLNIVRDIKNSGKSSLRWLRQFSHK